MSVACNAQVSQGVGSVSALDRDQFAFVISRLDGVRGPGDTVTARCPSHDDRNASLSVSRGDVKAVLLKCFAGCEPDAILRALNLDPSPILAARSDGATPRTSSYRMSGQPVPPGVTVAKLARDKGLPERWLREDVGLTDGIGREVVEIPYRNEQGAMLFTRTRTVKGGKSVTMQPSGVSLAPYGLDRLDRWQASDTPILVEGESDVWTLRHHGREAIGLPGASSAGCLELTHVDGAASLYVHQEPDQGGVTCYSGVRKRLAEIGWSGRLYVFPIVLDGRRIKDPNALHLAVGGDRAAFLAALGASLALAVPVEDDEPIGWDVAEDESAWPMAARARIAELEAALSDSSANCDGNCSTAVTLREQLREHKMLDAMRKNQAFSAGEVEVARYYAQVVESALSRGQTRVRVWSEETELHTGQSPATATRFHKAMRTFQADPEIGPTLPYRVEKVPDDKGKDHIELVIPAIPGDPSGRRKTALLVPFTHLRRSDDRKSWGGKRDRCPKCDSPMERTTTDRCTNGECGHVISHRPVTIGRTPVRKETAADRPRISFDVETDRSDAPPGDGPFHDEIKGIRTIGSQDEMVLPADPVEDVAPSDDSVAPAADGTVIYWPKGVKLDDVLRAARQIERAAEDQPEPLSFASVADLEPPVRPDDDDEPWASAVADFESLYDQPPSQACPEPERDKSIHIGSSPPAPRSQLAYWSQPRYRRAS